MPEPQDQPGPQWSWVYFFDRLIEAFFLASAAFVVYLIWWRLNYAQIDIAGHIASGWAFRNGLLHRFNDQFFLGYIHGLFYPPLEDAILAGLHLAFPSDQVFGYRIYLTALSICYLGAAFLLGQKFKDFYARSLWLLSFLCIFFVEKSDLLYYQGLSLIDLTKTGLSSEFLGAIFMLALVRDFLTETRSYARMTLLLFLSLISHIVIALVCLLLALLWCLRSRDRNIAFSVFMALGLAGFFIIPFVSYRDYLTAANIFGASTASLLGLALAGLTFSLTEKNDRAWICFGLAAFLFCFTTIGSWVHSHAFALPVFHYYRLAVIALLFLVIGTSTLLEQGRGAEFSVRWSLVLCLAVTLLQLFRFHRQDFQAPESTPPRLDVGDDRELVQALSPPEYGRFWVIGNQRTVDFGLDDLLAMKVPGFRSTKGLFWESSRNNTLLSSYLATLLAPPVVLDSFQDLGYYLGANCPATKCLLDHYIRDYNIQGWIVGNYPAIPGLGDDKVACYDQIIADGGTDHFRLTERGSGMYLDRHRLRVFGVSPKGAMSNAAIEPVDPAALKSIDRRRPEYYGVPLQDASQACLLGNVSERAYADARDLERIRRALPADPLTPPGTGTTELVPLGPGKFALKLGWDSPRLFRIKLSFLPGVELRDAQGRIMPIFDGFPHILAIGHSRMTLEYRRPPAVWAGYALTAAFGILCLWLRRRPGPWGALF